MNETRVLSLATGELKVTYIPASLTDTAQRTRFSTHFHYNLEAAQWIFWCMTPKIVNVDLSAHKHMRIHTQGTSPIMMVVMIM